MDLCGNCRDVRNEGFPLHSWSPAKSSLRSPAQAPCSREEQLEAPLAEALELVPEDDSGALDSNGTARAGGGYRGVTEIARSLESTGAASLPSWLTVEGLLTPVEMGLKMWE